MKTKFSYFPHRGDMPNTIRTGVDTTSRHPLLMIFPATFRQLSGNFYFKQCFTSLYRKFPIYLGFLCADACKNRPKNDCGPEGLSRLSLYGAWLPVNEAPIPVATVPNYRHADHFLMTGIYHSITKRPLCSQSM